MPNREDLGKLVLRVAVGGILLFHGIYKLRHGVAWSEEALAAFGLPGFLAYGTYLAEVVAPILLLVGYKARLAALVIGFDMLMAMLLVLRPMLFTIKERGGGGWGVELESLLLLAAVAVFLLGSGRYRLGRGAWD
jgi:putative oxidoreductase